MTKLELFEKASGGNKEALQFLNAVYDHFAAMHKFIDEKKQDPHEFIALMAKTNQCFSLPFYVRHADALQLSVLRVVNEPSSSLVFDVALITLGFEDTRKLLAELTPKE